MRSVFLGLVFFTLVIGTFTECKATDIDELVREYGDTYIQDPKAIALFRGMIKVESNDCSLKFLVGTYNPSFGCSQLKVVAVREASRHWGFELDKSEEWIVWRLLIDHEYNIKMGAAYFGALLDKFPMTELAVIAYNLGPTLTKSLLERGKALPLDYLNKVATADAVFRMRAATE